LADTEAHSQTTLRPATPADTPLIVCLIEELAEYERLGDRCRADPATLGEHLFGKRPYAEVIIAEHGSEPAGFALFFHTFSTFACAPSVYLEDLFVRPRFRRRGIGGLLLRRVAALAVERGCRRLEWAVLNWNRPAIEFYLRLGAEAMDGWTIYRLDGGALLAAGTDRQA